GRTDRLPFASVMTALELLSLRVGARAFRSNLQRSMSMAGKHDKLLMAIDRLELALEAGCCGDWRRQVGDALMMVESEARRHAPPVTPADGGVVDVDRPRLPSPGATRRAGELREDLCDLAEEARTLRDRLPDIQPQSDGQATAGVAGALSVAPEMAAV